MTMAASILTDPPIQGHSSVLLEETLEALAPADGLYVDATVGLGGHAHALLERAPRATLLGFDRDARAIEAAGQRLEEFDGRFQLVHSAFADAEAWLEQAGIGAVDGLIADLGVSSPQLDEPDRGMSFRAEGPIDMRMDLSRGETALELIERLSQDELANVIYRFGEERRSRRVARCVKQALEAGELQTTLDLRRAVVRAVGPRRVGGVDPATRTFQALRIAVNEELSQLSQLLAAAARFVRPGGVAVFISFHSLEDRLVKRAFADRETWLRLYKKPLTATDAERATNPRARSAKLRAARRLEAPDWTAAGVRSLGGPP